MCVCVCVSSVWQKLCEGDRSAANRSGIWKVENFFALVTSLVILANHKLLEK